MIYPKKILFAPIHPNGNGFLSMRERRTNRRTFQRLLTASRQHKLKLKVRYIHNLSWNGITKEQDVRYVKGQFDQSTKEIDKADIVVSHQTMAYLAIARGKPTLMMDESKPPMSGNTPGAIRTVKSWGKYKDLLQFPHDILAKEDTMNLLLDAAHSDEKIEKWRELFIGFPFRERLFISKIQSYL